MAKLKAVALVWYCKTPKGWTRFPVVFAANNRIKQGWVLVGETLTHYPQGHFEIRTYVNRKVVYKAAGDNAADAMAARLRQEHLEAARGSANAAGVKIVEDPKRLYRKRVVLAVL